MTIIDGIGDEVTYFFITVVIVIIATIAWITTDIHQGLYVRTVYLLENSRINQTRIRLSNHTESATISEGVAPATRETDGSSSSSTQPEEVLAAVNDVLVDEATSSNEDASLIDDDGPANIIQAMDDATDDGDAASVLRRRRLEHFQNRQSDNPNQPEEVTIDTVPQDVVASNITIKLKYINDDLKIVDGRLEEKLGDFKRRHFNVELASNKLVRLIFNGQVLQADAQTLESYGMFDNCVVHCLVHQPRSPPLGEHPTTGNQNANFNRNHANNAAAAAAQRDWDLGNLLIVTLSFTLGSAWYFRYQYPQLFTISTTVGLVALSGMFSVISISMYLPNFARRVQFTTRNQERSAATNTTTNQT